MVTAQSERGIQKLSRALRANCSQPHHNEIPRSTPAAVSFSEVSRGTCKEGASDPHALGLTMVINALVCMLPVFGENNSRQS